MSKKNSVLVFVTDQIQCERLIKAGKTLMSSGGGEVNVVSIRSKSVSKNLEGTALQHLFDVCSSVGASMTILYDDKPAKAAVKFIKKVKPAHIITGIPDSASPGNFAYEIRKAFPSLAMSVVDPDGKWYAMVTMGTLSSVSSELSPLENL